MQKATCQGQAPSIMIVLMTGQHKTETGRLATQARVSTKKGAHHFLHLLCWKAHPSHCCQPDKVLLVLLHPTHALTGLNLQGQLSAADTVSGPPRIKQHGDLPIARQAAALTGLKEGHMLYSGQPAMSLVRGSWLPLRIA